MKDDEQALAAYRQAFAISGKGNGWQLLTATIASGSYDHSAFTRTFRSATGMTPSEFRAQP